jgi:deoxyadenosine/deoxycytidine kinase
MIPIGMDKVSKIISIQGLIGAGKTTILQALEATSPPGYYFLHEPVEEWKKPIPYSSMSFLEAFYCDPEELAFVFQIKAFTSRMRTLCDLIKKIPEGEKGIIIMDGSMLSDKMYFDTVMKDNCNSIQKKMEMATYYSFFDLICTETNSLEKELLHVYSTPEDCLQKIKKRNRPGEEAITLEYLRSLKISQDKMLKDFKGPKSLIICGFDPDFGTDLIHTGGQLWEKMLK